MTSTQRLYLVLADLTLIIHAAFVAFVIVGLLLIWVGRFRRWAFVRNVWFRLAHLSAIGVVAAEALAGYVCPLTTWEDRLRLLAGGEVRYQGSFIQHWLHHVMFFDLDERVFTLAYMVFFLAVALSLWFVPPRWPRRFRME
jgi:polyferredoxin